jgi:drug/metabolite transporter (DMT)-like permease
MAARPEPIVFNPPLDLPAPQNPGAATGNMLGVASMLLWAAGFPAAEMLLATWPPLTLIAARLVIAVAFLLPVWIAFDGIQAVTKTPWLHSIWIGGLGFGIGVWMLLISQSLTDPVTVALIASAMPVVATIVEIIYRVRRPRVLFLIGLTASVLGAIIATWGQAPTRLGLGALTAVLSCFLFAWGSFRTVRDFPNHSSLGRATATFIGAALVMVLMAIGSYLLGFETLPSTRIDGGQIGLLLLFGIGSMALSQLCFISSIGRLGVAVSSLHMNIAPFYVMVIMTILGAAWSWQHAAGAAIVGLGVIISQRG